MKRLIVISCWLLCCAAFISVDALACSCELPPQKVSDRKLAKQAKKKSSAVFSGEVLEVVTKSDFVNVAKIRIKSKWKGVKDTEAYVSTGRGGGDCGFPFEVGRSYLIYATTAADGTLTTNICDRTKLLSEALQEIKDLGRKSR